MFNSKFAETSLELSLESSLSLLSLRLLEVVSLSSLLALSFEARFRFVVEMIGVSRFTTSSCTQNCAISETWSEG